MTKRNLFLILYIFQVSLIFSQQKGENKPIAPQEWVEKMSSGSWWLFKFPSTNDTKILTDNYSPRILDSLQAMGIHGGRLHWQAKDAFDQNLMLKQQDIDFFGNIIDDMTQRGMAVCLQIHTTDKDMNSEVKQRTINAWTQLCQAYQNKSYLLAMCPVIEFHGWEDFYVQNGDTIFSNDPEYDKQVRSDSLNWLYDTLTAILRQYNPNRIMSYKPWGAASRADFEKLTIPFANDPQPGNDTPFYYVVSMSGSYGIGDWWKWEENINPDTLQIIKEQTMRAGRENKDWGIHHALEYRKNTKIPFWIDHWDPNFWKNIKETFPTRWTIEQNLAYINFFMDTISAKGVAGAGMQTRRFWNEETNDLIRLGDLYLYPDYPEGDTMSVKMMQLLYDRINFPENDLPDNYCESYSLNNNCYIKKIMFNDFVHPSTYTNIGTSSENEFYQIWKNDTIFVVKNQVEQLTINIQCNSQDSLNMLDVYAWIDWNRDGDFNDFGENIMANTDMENDSLVLSFVIPNSAKIGLSLLRIRTHLKNSFGAAYCSATDYGEVEDYIIKIINPISCGWTGNEDNDWNNTNNWADGKIPDYTSNVFIPYLSTGKFYPVIDQNLEIKINALIVEPGAYVTNHGKILIKGR